MSGKPRQKRRISVNMTKLDAELAELMEMKDNIAQAEDVVDRCDEDLEELGFSLKSTELVICNADHIDTELVED